jgi:glycine/D-amino acid oxidase-like deaminating enzyme
MDFRQRHTAKKWLANPPIFNSYGHTILRGDRLKELHTGRLYWPTTTLNTKAYSALNKPDSAKVVVVGGGMSGIASAYTFTAAGLDTVLIERGRVAGGSTSANTGMLQYCSDIMLSDLKEQIGSEPAEHYYKSCQAALEHIAEMAQLLPHDVQFRRRSSLYYASTEQHIPKLKREYEALRDCGFEVEYWSGDDIARRFPFRRPGAIVTHGDAEINPLRFVLGLADKAVEAGLRIFEGTELDRHERLGEGKHRLHMTNGMTLDAEHVVYAVGYEPEELRGRLLKANFNRSYVIVTGQQTELDSWHERFLIWETARPYLYMRTTVDGRIITGGLDEDNERPEHSMDRQERKRQELIGRLSGMFPDASPSIDFEWNATFGESVDSLPFIGEDPVYPGIYYNLGYGGNGSVCCMMGAQIISNMIQGRADHPLPFIGMREFVAK